MLSQASWAEVGPELGKKNIKHIKYTPIIKISDANLAIMQTTNEGQVSLNSNI